jgi:prophage DNA circulation protein
MTWRQNLRRGTLGGVTFHTSDRHLKGGRRIKNHEFPKRNANFPEDMGKKTRTWSVDAYVIGDDYMAQRDRIIRECEREGIKQYTDHWGVSGRVVVDDFKVVETSQDGRFCKIQIDIMEAGGTASPVAIPATASILSAAAGGLIDAVKTQFNARTVR